ncbi:Zn-ribbon domain-containing OB-fold protein [Zhongshania aquimaris]|uniref:OB-fold domain-containing protein n=1 Tax=Zhongshania aquimaris TaxID=2857107 RepID=A0ABS6VWL5_9GAMM|nr:OB-fold domain-containing protein [Zhongshania aquimaris]MBW2942718.1 OB-fold domain-containing protein [Zhongshania aquimaris]
MSNSVTTETDNKHLDTILKVGGDPADLPFWNACEDELFLIHQCQRCKRGYWPASRCVDHGNEAMEWVAASGKATLHTYTIIHRTHLASMKDKVPFVVGVVELDEGPFFHTNIVDCSHSMLELGMPLQVKMARHENGLMLPMFMPAN